MIIYILDFIRLLFLSFNFNFFIASFLLFRYFSLLNLFAYIFTFLISLSYNYFFSSLVDQNQGQIEPYVWYFKFLGMFCYGTSFIYLLFMGILFLHQIFSLYTKLSLLSTLSLVLAILFIFILVSNFIHQYIEIFFSILYFTIVGIIFFSLKQKNPINFLKLDFLVLTFESCYKMCAHIPVMLVPCISFYVLEEKRISIKKIFAYVISILLFYGMLSFFLATRFTYNPLILKTLPQFFLYAFKDSFYLSQIINVFFVALTILVICKLYLYASLNFQKLIPTFDGKKIFSEIFVFFLIAGFLTFLYKRIIFFVPLFSLYVISVSFASLFYLSKDIYEGKRQRTIYLSILGNSIAIIISLFNMIFLKF